LPEHVNVHDALAPQTWLQPPPEHVKEHDPFAPQICSQPPPLQVASQVCPSGHSWWHLPCEQLPPPVEVVGVCKLDGLRPSSVVFTVHAATARKQKAEKRSESDAFCIPTQEQAPCNVRDRGVFGVCWRSPRLG
jgi:hypothetical protein